MKLLQYKNTKSKRLGELETRAREFEVLSSVSLTKILNLLESKESSIAELQTSTKTLTEKMGVITKINDA